MNLLTIIIHNASRSRLQGWCKHDNFMITQLLEPLRGIVDSQSKWYRQPLFDLRYWVPPHIPSLYLFEIFQYLFSFTISDTYYLDSPDIDLVVHTCGMGNWTHPFFLRALRWSWLTSFIWTVLYVIFSAFIFVLLHIK